MKLKLIFTVFLLIAICIVLYLLIGKKGNKDGIVIQRTVVDTIDVNKNAWNTLPLNNNGSRNGPVAYYIHSAYTGEKESNFTFYPVGDAFELLSTLKTETNTHYVYKDLHQWTIQNNVLRNLKKYVQIPANTTNALVKHDGQLLVKYFDYSISKNTIALEDTNELLTKSYEDVFGDIQDGGLSTACSLLSNDSLIFCISQYTNIVKRINCFNGDITSFRTIEKQDEYPEVTNSQNVTNYSFKQKPFLLHPISRLFGDKVYVLSAEENNPNLFFLDVYDINFKYIFSYALKNIVATDITDFCFLDENFALTSGNKYIIGKIANR